MVDRFIESTTPDEHGFESRLWTREIVADSVRERFGISLREAWARVAILI